MEYWLYLCFEMAMVHLVLHMSMLRELISDSVFILPLRSVEVRENLTYEKVSIEI